MINFRDIEYILYAAQSGSFAGAAKACNISQPSLSIQIKKVEDRLGNRIFVRSKKGVKLTSFGETIVPHLINVQKELKAIDTISQHMINQPKPHLKIGVIHTVAPYLLPRIKNEAQIQFSENSTHQLVNKLINEEIDAAILALPIKLMQLESIKLYREPYYLVSSENNPMLEQINMDNMLPPEGTQFLILSEEHCLGQHMVELCNLRQYQHETGDKYRATSLETIRQMVAVSNNLTLLPALAHRHNDGLGYRSLPKRFFREIGLVFNNQTPHLNDIYSFADEIKTLIGNAINPQL
jgi:LysR family hydrogen peroxide-inducible transcriptional activator